MEAKCIAFVRFILFLHLLLITEVHLEDFNEKEFIDSNHHRGCTYLHCEKDDVCVHRKFRCKITPCPSMLYCAKSRTESLRGPASCDTVHCTSGYVCMLKVRRCHWDEKCEQQIARCVSRKEFYEGPASCAGFKCPQGNYCILRESFCASPPCRLLRSCAKNKDIQMWFGKCRSLGCPSEYECFLRRPENNCSNPPCKHTPDCLTLRETEAADEYCRGWICPRTQMCSAEVVGSCVGNDCNIKRTCQEMLLVATNDSSSPFSRRSLRNEDEVPRVDVKRSRNTSQENGTVETKAPHRTLHSWMNHLRSKTELDAIELWINNAAGQRDLKQFQDWLRSIRDILGPSAYSDWLQAILSSRGVEFRKWLRASHDKLEAEKDAIFPDQERPHAVTENPYSSHDTAITLPVKESKKRIEEIDSLLKERNLTNIAEKLLVPNRILLPPYTALENALLNNLRESNRSPFFNYLLKYPIYTGEPFLSLRSPKIENNYEQPYIVLPVGNMNELSKPQVLNYGTDTDVENQQKIISRNEKLPGERNQNSSTVPEDVKNSSFITDNVPSLWTKVTKGFQKKLPQKEARPIEDSVNLPEGKMLMDKKQYFDDVPVDLLEKLIKSMQYSSIENVPETFNEKPAEMYHEQNLPKFLLNENYDRSSEWSSHHNEDMSKNKNLKESSNEFPFHDDSKRNFTNNFQEPEVSILLDKLGDIQSINHSNNFHSELPLHQMSDEDSDTMDLGLFFELNRENLLPYIKIMMEAIDQENDHSDQNPELNPSESSVKSSILGNRQLRIPDKSSKELKSSKTETSNSFRENLLNNMDPYDYRALEEGKLNNNFPSQNDVKQTSLNSETQQQNDWKTPELIYANEKPTIRSFYNLPSYGASDNGDVGLQDYHAQRKNNNDDEEIVSYHVETHSKPTDEDKFPK